MPRRFLALLVALLVGFVGAVVQIPQMAAADVHPYTTPGKREFNGRQWSTTCEQYSTTTQRCRAEIMATQVRVVKGKYEFVKEYVFNNLTYLPSNRSNWVGNPLAEDGQFIRDGRMWQTSCDDEWTGKNGCRSFIFATVIESTKTATGWTFKSVEKWVFNNVVTFSAPTTPPPPQPYNPCKAPAPAGWTFTADGRPHLIKPGYTPTDHYNPISLANFIKLAVRSKTMTDADRACFALLGANKLMEKAETRTHEGQESLWFPYPFTFSANPAVDDLPVNWNSGLGQAGAMTALLDLSEFVGENNKPASEQTWANLAGKIYNSYKIPLQAGGFTNRSNGFLWFEEYPTTPYPTVVNNGHHQNVLGLYRWWQHSQDPAALALFEEAVSDMESQTIKAAVPVEGGIMSSYDLMRGYPTTPLRAVPLTGGTTMTSAVLNGAQITAYPDNKPFHSKATRPASLPLTTRDAVAPNFMLNPTMTGVVNKVPMHWKAINNSPADLRGPDSNGMIGARPNGRAWAGLEQVVPAATWTAFVKPGASISFAMDSRLDIDKGQSGTGGKVAISSVCPVGTKTVSTLIHENAKNRSQDRASSSTSEFTAPAASCDIRVQLMTYSYAVKNTTAWYKNVSLRASDPLGTNVTPAYDLLVHRTPTNELTLTGTGQVAVEAWTGGRWLEFGRGNLSAGAVSVEIPERYTGRNLNYNYHDGHIPELQMIACLSGVKSLDAIAKQWSAMSAREPYRDFTGNTACKAPTYIDVAGERVLLEADPVPMEDTPEVFPTTMSLPEDATPEAAEGSEEG